MKISDVLEYIQELNGLDKTEAILEFKEIIEDFKGRKVMWLNDIPDRVREAALIYCDGDMEQTFEELSDIVMEFNKSPRTVVVDMELALEHYCTYESLCPICGEELAYNTWQEEREYQGYECSEEMNELICRNGCRLY